VGRFLSILAIVLVLYFIVTRPVTAANAAENLGGALASAADSLVVFTNSLVGDSTDERTTGTSSSGSSTETGTEGSGEGSSGASSSSTGNPQPVPTSVRGGLETSPAE
jgi:hypothetical protein